MEVLFIGAAEDAYSEQAATYLDQSGLTVSRVWSLRQRNEDLHDKISTWRGDLILHYSSYYRLSESVLQCARQGAINFHPSSPRYPGSGGVNWALYNGDLRFAVTVHLMDEQIDHGQIISVTELDILPIDTVSSLLQRTHELRLSVFFEFVDYLSKHGDDLDLQKLAEQYDGPAGGDKTYSIREIDELQIVDTGVDSV